MLLDGLYVPLTAPFYRDGSLYLRKLEHNVGRYSLTPASGLLVLGPGGEASALSDSETADVFKSAATSAAPEKVLIAGVARDSVPAALAIAAAAAEAHCDAILIGAPSIWPSFSKRDGSGQAELFTWFRALADRSPLPMVMLSSAQAPGLSLSVEILAELAQHPNILGVLDESLTVERLAAIQNATNKVQREATVTTVFAAVTSRMLNAQASSGAATFVAADALAAGGAAVATTPPVPALRTRSKQVGFQVLAGGNVPFLPLLQAGVNGIVPQLAACAPQACHEVYAAFKDGDPALAALKEGRIGLASALMRDPFGIAGIKYACDLNGYYGGSQRLPRLALDAAQKSEVEAAMREIRN